MWSEHSNSKEDRRWQVLCCSLKNGGTFGKSEISIHVHEIRRNMDFKCPNGGAIAGMSSVYDGKNNISIRFFFFF